MEKEEKIELIERLPLLILVAVVFLRPMASGFGTEVWGPRQFTNISLQAVPWGLLVYGVVSRRQKPLLPAAWGVVFMLSAAMVAAVFGINRFVSFDKICDLSGGLALMICAATWCRGERERRELIGVMLFSAAIVSLYGIYQYFWGFPRTIEFIIKEASNLDNADHYRQVFGQKRIFSTTFSPDMLAGFLAMALPLALGMMAESSAASDRLIYGFVLLVVVVAIYMTGSLGGWLAAGVGAAVWCFALFVDRRRRIISATIIGLAIILFSAGILARRSETLLDLKHPENPITQRLYFWGGGLNVAYHHPILGVGPGNFGIAYLGLKNKSAAMSRYAHNHLINELAEAGPVGLAGWVFIAAAFLIGAWRRVGAQAAADNSSDINKFEAGILAAGAAFLAHGLIDFDLEVPEIAGYFWALAGLSAVREQEIKTSGKNLLSGRSIVFGLVAFFLCALSLSRIPGDAYLQNARDSGEKDPIFAIWNYSRAMAWRPGDAVPYEERAKIWPKFDEGKHLVIEDFQKAAALSPYDPFVRMSMGEFLFNRKDYAGALNAFNEAIRLFPTWKVAAGWQKLANAKVLVEKQKYAEAKAELNAVLKEFPGHPAAQQGLEEIEEMERNERQ